MKRRAGATLLAVCAVVLLGNAGWIHAKAAVAQWLLHEAWQASLGDGRAHRPWPWADTHPVARLQVPHLAIDQIVLAGDSPRVLAFGPGWAEASAAPGRVGTLVVSGHRDTHFKWLRELRTGDEIAVESVTGQRRYRVTGSQVVDSRRQRLALDEDTARLQLVTCWPFDAVTAGGPLRYVVSAVAL